MPNMLDVAASWLDWIIRTFTGDTLAEVWNDSPQFVIFVVFFHAVPVAYAYSWGKELYHGQVVKGRSPQFLVLLGVAISPAVIGVAAAVVTLGRGPCEITERLTTVPAACDVRGGTSFDPVYPSPDWSRRAAHAAAWAVGGMGATAGAAWAIRGLVRASD